MKKIIHIFIVLMLLGGNNLNADYDFKEAISMSEGIFISPAMPLAPYLSKNEDIYCNCAVTLLSALLVIIPTTFIATVATGNDDVILSSMFISPFIGGYLGYNFSKTKDPLVAMELEKKVRITAILSLITIYAAIGLTFVSSK